MKEIELYQFYDARIKDSVHVWAPPSQPNKFTRRYTHHDELSEVWGTPELLPCYVKKAFLTLLNIQNIYSDGHY